MKQLLLPITGRSPQSDSSRINIQNISTPHHGSTNSESGMRGLFSDFGSSPLNVSISEREETPRRRRMDQENEFNRKVLLSPTSKRKGMVKLWLNFHERLIRIEKNQKEILRLIRQKTSDKDLGTPVKPDILRNLPIQDLNSFLEFETKLLEKTHRHNLVSSRIKILWRRTVRRL